jgi:hypothetical protein
MKQIISAVAIAGLFTATACNNSAVKQRDAAIQMQKNTIDSMNAELAKKRVVDSMSELVNTQYVLTPPATTSTGVAPTSVSSASRTVRHSYSGRAPRRSTTTRSASSSASQPVVYQEAPAPRKKGWSAKAKGAVIGTATGAAAGAIINKRNRAAGAVIGGVLGAGAGTGVGAVIDKKNGR